MVNYDEDDDVLSNGCRKLTLSFLTKHGFLKDNCIGTITWEIAGKPAGSLKVITNVLFTDKPFIKLVYTEPVRGSGELKEYEHLVYLARVNSSLEPDKYFYYFICPLTGKKTSILYKPVTADMWLHREAFKMLTSSSLQDKSIKNLEGKYGLELENKIAKMRQKLKLKLKKDYKRVPVKLAERLRELENRVNKFYFY